MFFKVNICHWLIMRKKFTIWSIFGLLFVFSRKYIFKIYIYIHVSLFSSLPCFNIVCLMVFNATFNNISVISWRSVLLAVETGGPGENNRPVASHWQTLSHNVVHLAWARFEVTTSVVMCTDFIGSCKSSYPTITTTTAPFFAI